MPFAEAAVVTSTVAAANLVVRFCSNAAVALQNATADLNSLKDRLEPLKAACTQVATIFENPEALLLSDAWTDSLQSSLQIARTALEEIQKELPVQSTSSNDPAASVHRIQDVSAKTWQVVKDAFSGSNVEYRLKQATATINSVLDQFKNAKPLGEALSSSIRRQTEALLQLGNVNYRQPGQPYHDVLGILATILATGSCCLAQDGSEYRHILLHGPMGIGKTSMLKAAVTTLLAYRATPAYELGVLFAS